MSLLHVVRIIIRSLLWISSCIEPSTHAFTETTTENCDCTDLNGIVVLELDSVNRVRHSIVSHIISHNVSSAAHSIRISTAVAVGIRAELILDVLAAPPALNIVAPVWWILAIIYYESLLTVLSIVIEIVAELQGFA